MILELKDLTGSLTKSLDIIYALDGNKPVSRILVGDEKEKLIEFLSENNLHHELSDFKILKKKDSARDYSDKGIKVGKDNSSKGVFAMYISKDEKLANAAKKFEEEDNHKELGKILGYPQCCCDFFDEHAKEASLGSNDFTIHTFKQSKGFYFPWYANNCLRAFDISLISHFPCNFNCEETKKIALKNLATIQKYDSDIALYFSHSLKGGVLYSDGVGVYNFRDMKMVQNLIFYNPKEIVASKANKLLGLLKEKNRIVITGKNSFLFGDVKVQDDRSFLGIFS